MNSIDPLELDPAKSWGLRETDPFRVRPFSPAEMLEKGEQWATLVSRSNADPLFMSREWLSSWWDVFGSRSKAQWAGIKVEDAKGNAKAICPLFLRTGKLRGILPVTRLEPLGGYWNGPSSVLTQYSQFLGDFASKPCLMTSVLDSLDEKRGWSELALPKIQKKSECLLALEGEARNRGWRVRTTSVWPSQVIRLEDGFDEYLRSLSSKTRQRLYHQRKKLNGLGRVRFRHVSLAESDRFLHLMNSLRKQHRGSVALKDRALEFHRVFLKRLEPPGELRLSLLSLDDRPISVNYALRFGKREYGVQMGFDAGVDHRLSLGMLHLGYALEAAAADGMDSYDLMGGPGKDPGWKGSVANAQVEMVAVQVVKGKPLSRLYDLYDRYRGGACH